MKRNNGKLLQLLLVSIVALCSGCVNPEIKNVDARGKTIVCFGDSVTLGYGVDVGQDYPFLLAKMVTFPVINSGIDGEISTEAIKRMKSDVFDKEPLLVIIEFGGNDFLRKIPLSETVKNIEEMIKQFQAKGIMVALADISTGIIMSEYGKEIKHLSKKYGAIYVPGLLSGIITNPSLKSDFIHPNVEGYKIVTHRVYRAILPYLNRNMILRGVKEGLK